MIYSGGDVEIAIDGKARSFGRDAMALLTTIRDILESGRLMGGL
jgi:hypothetical protein